MSEANVSNFNSHPETVCRAADLEVRNYTSVAWKSRFGLASGTRYRLFGRTDMAGYSDAWVESMVADVSVDTYIPAISAAGTGGTICPSLAGIRALSFAATTC